MSVENKPFVTVSKGMRGYFAVHYWWNPEGFHEPWATDPMSFKDAASAEPTAKAWAEAEGIDYVPRTSP